MWVDSQEGNPRQLGLEDGKARTSVSLIEWSNLIQEQWHWGERTRKIKTDGTKGGYWISDC